MTTFDLIKTAISDGRDSVRLWVAAGVYTLPISMIACELVPGWELFHLEVPSHLLWIACGLAGAIAGIVQCERFPIPGLIGGMTGAICSLALVTARLSEVEFLSRNMMLLLILVGTVPGVFVGNWVKTNWFAEPVSG